MDKKSSIKSAMLYQVLSEIGNDNAANNFILKYDSFDDLLNKIHLDRIKGQFKSFYPELLFSIFKINKDIRFFNEILWFEQKQNIIANAKELFYRNIDQKGHFNYNYSKELKYCLHLNSDCRKALEFSFLSKKKVCLIGNPFHFIKAYKTLSKNNIDVDIINVNVVSKKNRIYEKFPLRILLRLTYRMVFNENDYFEFKLRSIKDLNSLVMPFRYDIGFHKLNYIIPTSLYAQFNHGLINDHWGALPLFKGRSTLDYSKLFGANLIATNHFIHKKIDSGKIICYTELNPDRLNREIYLGLSDRIIKSLIMFFKEGTKENIDNREGIVFYEMHPWLKKYIKRKLD